MKPDHKPVGFWFAEADHPLRWAAIYAATILGTLLLSHAGAKLLREAIERRFLNGEVHQLFLANHITRHRTGVAQTIDQAQRQRLLA